MSDYTYTGHTRKASRVDGTAVRGIRKAGTRKGDRFMAKDVTVIENRLGGTLDSVTVLNSTGQAVVRLGSDARIF